MLRGARSNPVLAGSAAQLTSMVSQAQTSSGGRQLLLERFAKVWMLSAPRGC